MINNLKLICGTKNKVLVKEEQTSNKTKSGLIITDKDKSKYNVGKIYLVSTVDEDLKEPIVKINDKIIFYTNNREFEYEGETFLLIRESEIIGIIN